MKGFFFLITFMFYGQQVVGQTTSATVFRFLELPPNAYASSLGGNHTGLFDADFSLYHINPGYLSNSPDRTVSASFINYLADAKMGFSNAVWQLDEQQRVAFGARFLNYGDFQSLDENGNDLGDFRALDLAIGGAYSTSLNSMLSVGGSIDFIYSSYESFQSTAIALGGGIYYRDKPKHFSAGIAIRNAGTQLSEYYETREPLPLDVSIGITKKPASFPAEISLTFRRLNEWNLKVAGESAPPDFVENLFRHVIIGGEFNLSSNFHFRLGYNHLVHEMNKTKESFDLAGTSIGIGFMIKSITIDISRASYSETGGVLQFSIKSHI